MFRGASRAYRGASLRESPSSDAEPKADRSRFGLVLGRGSPPPGLWRRALEVPSVASNLLPSAKKQRVDAQHGGPVLPHEREPLGERAGVYVGFECWPSHDLDY